MKKKLIPLIKWVAILTIFATTAALSAPYAAIVIDAETGEVLHEENADTRLHPAGLTKLITLYATFDAIETGIIGLDDTVRISLKAAHEPPVKLGLRDGQRVLSNKKRPSITHGLTIFSELMQISYAPM